jgi:hypothetical protein
MIIEIKVYCFSGTGDRFLAMKAEWRRCLTAPVPPLTLAETDAYDRAIPAVCWGAHASPGRVTI